jgi:hypothetical protein
LALFVVSHIVKGVLLNTGLFSGLKEERKMPGYNLERKMLGYNLERKMLGYNLSL